MISVVMTSYNGIKYIGEQLDSLRTQTLSPDEVIICDDCSSDGTFEFCRDYIAKHNLTGWKIYRNQINLGVGENFRLALSKSTGEYIFTCDQDDIWLPDKIQSMTQAMKTNPDIKLLVSNYIAIDSKRQQIRVPLKNINRNDGKIIKLPLKNYWFENVRPGCVFCFRREILDKFRVLDFPEILHDAMIWRYAAAQDSIYLINRQLIYFRRHENNATDAFHAALSINTKIKSLQHSKEFYGAFTAHSQELGINETNRKLLESKTVFISRRIKTLAGRNLFAIIYFVITNMNYYPTLRNALSDIYAAIFLNK